MAKDKKENKLGGIWAKLINLADKPGVYLMKDARQKIIYIGKAKKLRKRLLSYWKSEKDLKTKLLLQQVKDIEVILTRSEDEALVTENNLIKQHQPKYNINLKDGKTYPVLRLTNEKYPRLFRTRRLIFDSSRYYGPYPKVNDLDIAINIIEKNLPLRKCKNLKTKKNPCLYYHIKRCPGVCAGKIDLLSYQKRVEEVIEILEGKTDKLNLTLKQKMQEAVLELNFEEAAILRDQLEALCAIKEASIYQSAKQRSADCLGVAFYETTAVFVVLKLKEGKIISQEKFNVAAYSSKEEILFQFLFQYYSAISNKPEIVYLPFQLEESQLNFLSQQFKLNFYSENSTPPEIVELQNLAQNNALQALKFAHLQGLAELQNLLSLKDLPNHIEAFDIAHLAGKYTVASCVCFIDGKKAPEYYRRFKLRTLQNKIDDFQAIAEVVARRYTKVIAEQQALPDLILIDGGKAQLTSACKVLTQLGLAQLPVISLAKKNEEIYIKDRAKPILLKEDSAALRLLVALRDEAHRFANSYHRVLRDGELSCSILEKVKGIGSKKAKILLNHFGSLEKILQSDPSELAKIAKLKSATVNDLQTKIKEVLGEI